MGAPTTFAPSLSDHRRRMSARLGNEPHPVRRANGRIGWLGRRRPVSVARGTLCGNMGLPLGDLGVVVPAPAARRATDDDPPPSPPRRVPGHVDPAPDAGSGG